MSPTGEPGSAEPLARQGSAVGAQRLTGLQVCWGRGWQSCGAGMAPGQQQGPGGGKAGPRESWWCPQSLTSSWCRWSLPLLLSWHPCCLRRAMSQGLCCHTQPVFLCTSTSSFGMTAGHCFLYRTVSVLCRAKQKENKLGPVCGWFAKVPRSCSRWEPWLQPQSRVQHCQPCSSGAAQVGSCI